MSIFVSSKYRQVITYSIMKQENIPWELIISKFKQEISEEDDARLMSSGGTARVPVGHGRFECRVEEGTGEDEDYTPDKEYYWKVLSARIGKAGKPQVEVLQEKASGKTFTLRSLYRYIAAACVVLVLSVGMSYYWVSLWAGSRWASRYIPAWTASRKYFCRMALEYGSRLIQHWHTVTISGIATTR